MSLETNSRFIEEYNYLDDILKDMYPCDIQSKLGVTRYLEDMKSKEYSGACRIQSWEEDYERLRYLRNNRNDAIHNNMLNSNLFDNEDICWIIDFKKRVLSATDPLSLLEKAYKPNPPKIQTSKTQAHYNDSTQDKAYYPHSLNNNEPNYGKSPSVAPFLIIIVIIILVLYLIDAYGANLL